jgi:carbon monoxide dehydrogenase subunit G
MRIEGSRLVRAPRAAVWAALNDPQVLKRVTPGCEKLEAAGADQYSVTLKVGVAAIKGTFNGSIHVRDKQEPERFVMDVSASGTSGWVKMTGQVTLTEQGGGTLVAYDWDVQIGGAVAAVGQRVVGGVAKLLIDQMFGKVDAVLGGAA